MADGSSAGANDEDEQKEKRRKDRVDKDTVCVRACVEWEEAGAGDEKWRR